jgi:hypothetical protein
VWQASFYQLLCRIGVLGFAQNVPLIHVIGVVGGDNAVAPLGVVAVVIYHYWALMLGAGFQKIATQPLLLQT